MAIFITALNFRPCSCEVLSHCFFWPNTKKLDFFRCVFNEIKKNPDNYEVLEQDGTEVVGNNWLEQISNDDLKKGIFMSRTDTLYKYSISRCSQYPWNCTSLQI